MLRVGVALDLHVVHVLHHPIVRADAAVLHEHVLDARLAELGHQCIRVIGARGLHGLEACHRRRIDGRPVERRHALHLLDPRR
jgi:hypothetical protein